MTACMHLPDCPAHASCAGRQSPMTCQTAPGLACSRCFTTSQRRCSRNQTPGNARGLLSQAVAQAELKRHHAAELKAQMAAAARAAERHAEALRREGAAARAASAEYESCVEVCQQH